MTYPNIMASLRLHNYKEKYNIMGFCQIFKVMHSKWNAWQVAHKARIRKVEKMKYQVPADDDAIQLFSLFDFQSFTAALTASSANMEQWSFTGGSFKCAATSVFRILRDSSTVLPFNHSVAKELLAIALPQPNVLNFASLITPLSSTSIYKDGGRGNMRSLSSYKTHTQVLKINGGENFKIINTTPPSPKRYSSSIDR